MHPNSTQEQRSRMLHYLRLRPVSTLEARRELDILHPAGRVMELRREGYQISTVTTTEHSECGRAHKVARYVLMAEGNGVPAPTSP